MSEEIDKKTVEEFLKKVIEIEEESASSKGKQESARREKIHTILGEFLSEK